MRFIELTRWDGEQLTFNLSNIEFFLPRLTSEGTDIHLVSNGPSITVKESYTVIKKVLEAASI
jgi:uncharacterized protein YlzI (FlbEa/FlbD family)